MSYFYLAISRNLNDYGEYHGQLSKNWGIGRWAQRSFLENKRLLPWYIHLIIIECIDFTANFYENRIKVTLGLVLIFSLFSSCRKENSGPKIQTKIFAGGYLNTFVQSVNKIIREGEPHDLSIDLEVDSDGINDSNPMVTMFRLIRDMM